MDNHSIVTVEGVCPKCKQRVRAQIHYASYAVHKNYVMEKCIKNTEYHIKEHLLKEHGMHMVAEMTSHQTRRPVRTEVFSSWVDMNYDSTATVTVSCNTTTSDAWSVWSSDSSTTTTATSTVWVVWTDSSSNRYYGVDYGRGRDSYREYHCGEWKAWGDQVEETKAQREAREKRERQQREEHERRMAEQRQRDEERKAREAAAAERARELLREVLTNDQNKELDEKGHFELKVVGGSRYRIKKGNAYNVEKLDEQGQVKEKLCFNLPQHHTYDTMVMQKLMLECDEEGARRAANISQQ
jgi:hypothetical protein